MDIRAVNLTLGGPYPFLWVFCLDKQPDVLKITEVKFQKAEATL